MCTIFLWRYRHPIIFSIPLQEYFASTYSTITRMSWCHVLFLFKKRTNFSPCTQFKREYFSENLGLFRFVSVSYETDLFISVVSIKVRKPKQTEIFSFWFHETNRNKRETDLVSVCFGSNRNLFLFVSRTPYSAVKQVPFFSHLRPLKGGPIVMHSRSPAFKAFFF